VTKEREGGSSEEGLDVLGPPRKRPRCVERDYHQYDEIFDVLRRMAE
jgi:hypothetical protein